VGKSASRVPISTAFGCLFEGRVDPDHVNDIAGRIAVLLAVAEGLPDLVGHHVPGQLARGGTSQRRHTGVLGRSLIEPMRLDKIGEPPHCPDCCCPIQQ